MSAILKYRRCDFVPKGGRAVISGGVSLLQRLSWNRETEYLFICLFIYLFICSIQFNVVGKHLAWQGDAGGNLCSLARAHGIGAPIIRHYSVGPKNPADSDRTQLWRLSPENVRLSAFCHPSFFVVTYSPLIFEYYFHNELGDLMEDNCGNILMPMCNAVCQI